MKSLGTRLALILVLLLLCLMTVAGFWIERQLTQSIYDEEVDQAKVHANTLLSSLRTLMLNGQGILAREWLDSMHGVEGIIDIEVLRGDGTEAFTDLKTVHDVNGYLGTVVFQREPVLPHHVPFPSVDAFKSALSGEVAMDLRFANEITVLQPIKADTECMSCHGYDNAPLRGVLKLSLSREPGQMRLEVMRTNLWAIAAVLIVVIAMSVWLVLRISVLSPINRLRDAIIQVGSGERHVSLPTQWRDELGQVATVFEEMQQQLVSTETRIRAVTENLFDAIVTTDENGTIDSVNHAVEMLFGYEAEELVGQNVSILMPVPFRDEHNKYIDKYLLTGKGGVINNRAELLGQRKNGSAFQLEVALSEMFIGKARYFVGVMRDITDKKRQTEELEYQAMHDALTELPNRTLLSDRVRQGVLTAQRDHNPMGLIIMDLDRFKDINDTLGHLYGDKVLQQVAMRMRNVLRESDTIARLGGDEFAVLLPRTEIDQVKNIAEKLIKAIEEPFAIDDQTLHVGASLGISLFPQHGDDEVTLMQRADVAMYVAKRGHTGFEIYDPNADQHSMSNLALLGELRGAIERDQLVLHFQPKIDLKSGKVFGVEALVRWQHPEHGLMYPDEFIPLAEQTGLIAPLSLWVLKSGLLTCQNHHVDDFNISMAINLSVRNLHESKFPDKVRRLIGEHCDDPGRLRLEITETAIMADPPRALAVLDNLSDMGVHLSIDDFGTGYSSLAHLKQMPVDELKVDKSFVMNMVNDEDDAVIVRSIIDLAHNIGIKVVAEGVENQEVYDMLKELECDAIQGHFISQPLPVDELMKWMETSPWGKG